MPLFDVQKNAQEDPKLRALQSATFGLAEKLKAKATEQAIALIVEKLGDLRRQERLEVLKDLAMYDIRLAMKLADQLPSHKISTKDLIKVFSASEVRAVYPNFTSQVFKYLSSNLDRYHHSTRRTLVAASQGQDLFPVRRLKHSTNFYETQALVIGLRQGLQGKYDFDNFQFPKQMIPNSFAPACNFIRNLSRLIEGEYYTEHIKRICAFHGYEVPDEKLGSILTKKQLGNLLQQIGAETDSVLLTKLENYARKTQTSIVFQLKREKILSDLKRDLGTLAKAARMSDPVLGYNSAGEFGLYESSQAAKVVCKFEQFSPRKIDLWSMDRQSYPLSLPHLNPNPAYHRIFDLGDNACLIQFDQKDARIISKNGTCTIVDFEKHGLEPSWATKLYRGSGTLPNANQYNAVFPSLPVEFLNFSTVQIFNLNQGLHSADLDALILGRKENQTIVDQSNNCIVTAYPNDQNGFVFQLHTPHFRTGVWSPYSQPVSTNRFINTESIDQRMIIEGPNNYAFILSERMSSPSADQQTEHVLFALTEAGQINQAFKGRPVLFGLMADHRMIVIENTGRVDGPEHHTFHILHPRDPSLMQNQAANNLDSSFTLNFGIIAGKICTTRNHTYLSYHLDDGVSNKDTRYQLRVVANKGTPESPYIHLEEYANLPKNLNSLVDAFTYAGHDYFILTNQDRNRACLYDENMKAISPVFWSLVRVEGQELKFFAQDPDGCEFFQLHTASQKLIGTKNKTPDSAQESLLLMAECLLTTNPDLICDASLALDGLLNRHPELRTPDLSLKALRVVRPILRTHKIDFDLIEQDCEQMMLGEVAKMLAICSPRILEDKPSELFGANFRDALGSLANFWHDLHLTSRPEKSLPHPISRTQVAGGNPRTTARDKTVIANFNRSFNGFLYTAACFEYQPSNNLWVRSAPALDLEQSHKSGRKLEVTCQLQTKQMLNGLLLPNNSKLSKIETAEGRDCQESLTSSPDFIPSLLNTNQAGSIKYEIEVFPQARINERMTGLEYELLLKNNPKFNLDQNLEADLPSDLMGFCHNLHHLPPWERIKKIHAFIQSVGFYDLDNGEVSASKVGIPMSQKLEIMAKRMLEIKEQEKIDNPDLKYAMVCTDAAELGALMMRAAGLQAGIGIGYQVNGNKCLLADAHAISIAAWPISEQEVVIVEVDCTPVSSTLEGLRHLSELFFHNHSPQFSSLTEDPIAVTAVLGFSDFNPAVVHKSDREIFSEKISLEQHAFIAGYLLTMLFANQRSELAERKIFALRDANKASAHAGDYIESLQGNLKTLEDLIRYTKDQAKNPEVIFSAILAEPSLHEYSRKYLEVLIADDAF